MSRNREVTRQERAVIEETVNAILKPPAVIERTITWPETIGKGQPRPNSMVNAMAAIKALRLDCRYDVFRRKMTINGQSLESFAGELSDAATRLLREQMFREFDHDCGREAISQALLRCCEKRSFNPVVDHFASLVWDGVPRVGRWLTTYIGAEDTPLLRAQGAIVLQAMVARAFRPGIKFDHVMVFEGPEGVGKSSIVQVLANGKRGCNDFFSDSPVLALKEQQQMEQTRGILAYELAELAGMKKGDQYAIKNFITKTEDRARGAYDRFVTVQPRSCVFFGTFNTTPEKGELVEYLNPGDQRRWWPVRVGAIDIEALERDRDQLFAEVMQPYGLYLLGVDDLPEPKLYLPPELEAEARGIAALREMPDTLTDIFSTLYAEALHMADSQYPTMPDGAGVSRSDCVFDGRPIKRITKGGESVPFSCVDAVEVWLSTQYVSTLARGREARSITNAMTKLGWRKLKDRRSGSHIWGWAKRIEADLAEAAE